VLRRFKVLRLAGAEGRAFCARLFGLHAGADPGKHVPPASRDWAVKMGLMASGTEATAPPG